MRQGIFVRKEVEKARRKCFLLGKPTSDGRPATLPPRLPYVGNMSLFQEKVRQAQSSPMRD